MSGQALPVWCKICGITVAADVDAAVDAGVDAIGFNFYPQSSRCVSMEVATKLCERVPAHVMKVGLFVDASSDEVNLIARTCGLDLLQFHGEETAEFCSQFGLPYMRALRMMPGLDIKAEIAHYDNAWAILLDAYVEGSVGGTGRTFDWSLWPGAVMPRMVLAGGLTPDNVAEAIERLQPFGVDVAGGVEGSVKGLKDHGLIKKFMKGVRNGRRSTTPG